MNISNKLTLSRIFMTPFFVGFLLAENVTTNPTAVAVSRWTALVIFIVASITDYYDGEIARRRNLVTNFGKLMDPLADKILMTAALILVAVEPKLDGAVPVWLVIAV